MGTTRPDGSTKFVLRSYLLHPFQTPHSELFSQRCDLLLSQVLLENDQLASSDAALHIAESAYPRIQAVSNRVA